MRDFTRLYIDAFAGSGRNIAKDSGETVAGSPSLALSTTPPFHEFHFIDIQDRKIKSLQRLAATRKDVVIHNGDCNQVLLDEVFPRCRYEDFARDQSQCDERFLFHDADENVRSPVDVALLKRSAPRVTNCIKKGRLLGLP